MHQDIRDSMDWEQPFTAAEYAGRRAKVRAAMAEAGIDGIFVTSPADVCYLTGYDQIWQSYANIIGTFPPATETVVVVSAES